MVSDPLEPLTAACGGIAPGNESRAHDLVTWCPAWGQWLCFDCRLKRNDDELRIPAQLAPAPRDNSLLLHL
jgi:hypothetical protein